MWIILSYKLSHFYIPHTLGESNKDCIPAWWQDLCFDRNQSILLVVSPQRELNLVY